MKWEDICSRCGLCCHEKIVDGDFLIIGEETCPFFDADTRLCRVYGHRFETCPRCMKVNLFRACFARYLPSSCAYVRWARARHIRLVRERTVILSYGKDTDSHQLD